MEEFIMPLTRAVEPIDRILAAFVAIFDRMFGFGNNHFFKMLVTTIINNPLLLISVSLVFCGFVIGLLKRLISL